MHHSLSLQSSDASIALNDVLGRIAFAASNETGSDALKVAAIVSAIAEGDFDATSNPTSLVFSTGHSETATEKMRITSQGNVGIGTDDPLHKLEIRYNASSDEGLAVLREGSTNDGILIGEQAFPVNEDYQGITHPLYNGTSDYMLISRGDHTYMSAKSGYGSYIRSGANGTSYQLYIGPNEASIATNALRVTSSECVLNEAGGNRDFRVEGDAEQNLIFADASADRVGIHTAFPQKDFHVQGTTALRGGTILGGSNIPSASQSIKVVDDSIFSDTATFNTDIVASSGLTLSNAIPATTTNKLYNDAGTLMWDGSEVGGGSSNLVRGSFAVTSSTTVFTVSGGYSTGSLDVYQNGVKLFKGSSYDFTETGGGTTFTLSNAATNGDLIEYVALNASTSATGNTSLGSVSVTTNQTVFNTSDTFTSSNLAVFLNGVKLVDGTDYNVTSSSQFTLTSTAVSGDIVEYIAYGATVASSNLSKTGDTMTGNLTVNADLIVTGYKETHTDNGNTSTAQTIDISDSTLQTYTLTGNCTFTMPTADAGRSFTVFIKTGAGSLTASFTGVKFPSNATPVITTDANRMDLVTFYSDGTNWYGSIQQGYHI